MTESLFVDTIAKLLCGGSRVRFLAPGWSMYPTIRNNEVIGVEPVEPSQIKRGDIILYRNERGVIAHRVVRITKERPRASRTVSLKDRGSCLKRSDPRTPACGRQEVLLKRSAPQTKCSLIEHSALSFERSSLSPHHSVLSIESSASSEALNRKVQGEALLKAGGRSSNAVPLERSGPFFVLRGDASDTCDEPVEATQILGKVVSVERDGRTIDLNSKRTKIVNTVGNYAYRLRRTISNHIRTNGIMEKWNIGIMG